MLFRSHNAPFSLFASFVSPGPRDLVDGLAGEVPSGFGLDLKVGSPALGLDIGGRFLDLDLDIEVGPPDSGPVVSAKAPNLDLNISAGGGLRGPQDWTTFISYVLRKLKSHKKIF